MGGRSEYGKRAKTDESGRSLSRVRALSAVRTASVLAAVLVAPSNAHLGGWQAWGIRMAAAAGTRRVADPMSKSERRRTSAAIAKQKMYAPAPEMTEEDLQDIIKALNVEAAARRKHNDSVLETLHKGQGDGTPLMKELARFGIGVGPLTVSRLGSILDISKTTPFGTRTLKYQMPEQYGAEISPKAKIKFQGVTVKPANPEHWSLETSPTPQDSATKPQDSAKFVARWTRTLKSETNRENTVRETRTQEVKGNGELSFDTTKPITRKTTYPSGTYQMLYYSNATRSRSNRKANGGIIP